MAETKFWQSKVEARSEALSRLKSLKGEMLEESQNQLGFYLGAFVQEQNGIWGAYRSLPEEANPSKVINNNPHIRWVYPRVSDDTLEFFLEPKVWKKGPFGIEEPDPNQSKPISLEKLTGYLVPGLAFDQEGNRLGRGRGYFDRALKNFKGLKVGIAFDAQVFSNKLPVETFDIPMDIIVTNRGVLHTQRKGDRSYV